MPILTKCKANRPGYRASRAQYMSLQPPALPVGRSRLRTLLDCRKSGSGEGRGLVFSGRSETHLSRLAPVGAGSPERRRIGVPRSAPPRGISSSPPADHVGERRDDVVLARCGQARHPSRVPSQRTIRPAPLSARIISSHLSLALGARLGPYEVVAKIGEGGPPPLPRVCMWELRRDLVVADRSAR